MYPNTSDENRAAQPINQYVRTGIAALLLLCPLMSQAGGVVTSCTESALRAAMAGGGIVTFACDGTITLAGTVTNSLDTLLDATGHQITISGNAAVRVFYVPTNATLALNHLTIADGRNTNGAGIFNDNGTVNATNTTFEGNQAVGASPPCCSGTPGASVTGGAVANSGTVNLVNCAFSNNAAMGGAVNDYDYGVAGGSAAGGAVWNSGVLAASGCTFAGNSAAGGHGGKGYVSPFGQSVPGGAGGDASGGGLFNSGVARLVNCTLAFNQGAGGVGGEGGAGYPFPPYPPPSNPGVPGVAFGAIYDASGQCYLTNCTVAFNSRTDTSWSSFSCGGIGTSGASLVNTLLAQNLPGGNGLGAFTDLGHNLSSDTSCALTNPTSLNNTYPLLGPLTNNGGLTATIALLPGCRAIDAGDTAAAPPTDQRGVARPFGPAADIGAYEYDSPTNPGPSAVVTECTESGLRNAMSAGGTVTFACDGTITLSNTMMITTNTVLDAAHHQITLSGAGLGVFYVNPNVTFAVANLTIANTAAPTGPAIWSAGSLQATNCVFSGNAAAWAGAIRNQGEAYFLGCVFRGNQASAPSGTSSGQDGGSAWAGAVDNSGTLTVELCSFIGNSALGAGGLPGTAPGQYGTPGGSGGDGLGGAIRNLGTLTVLRSTFTNNLAVGGSGANGAAGFYGDPGMNGGSGGGGGAGGSGKGGAIYNAGAARVVGSTFAFNQGTGGRGGAGGYGGGSAWNHGGNGGSGGSAGLGVGALYNFGNLQLINTTFAFNSGSSANGGAGADAGSGVFGGDGGPGGYGGSGFGALYDDLSYSCRLTNCTLAANTGGGWAGGAGSQGGYGSISSGIPGAAGAAGAGCGGIRTGGAGLVNTLLTGAGGNCAGFVLDISHNLSSDATCALTNVGSMNNTDPKLGPLADNGGPTFTMALLPGSPAIDAGDTAAAPPTDQRGFARPSGPAADIGAYEIWPSLSARSAEPGTIVVCGSGLAAHRTCHLLASTNLLNWVPVAMNQVGADGTVVFYDNCAPGGACRFYRVVMP